MVPPISPRVFAWRRFGWRSYSRSQSKRRDPNSTGRRPIFLVVASVMGLSAGLLVAEVALRRIWSPRYCISSDSLLVGSGQTRAGKKWWPSTTFRVTGPEFDTIFRTNAAGYRARPSGPPPPVADPYRIAFVGDSFTEAMQVDYNATFCARLERLLNEGAPARPRVCINHGISATDLFDYWHRIVHDVLTADPPDALVLCIYPGNDFQPTPPADGFDAEGRPLREYFRNAGLIKHVIVWNNLHSKLAFYLRCLTRSLGPLQFFCTRRPTPRHYGKMSPAQPGPS